MAEASRALVEELTPAPDPVHCCERLEGLPYRAFIDSARHDARLGRFSFLTADPVAVIRAKGTDTERVDLLEQTTTPVSCEALDAIAELLKPHVLESDPRVPPFQGGALGYIAYDWGRTLEQLPAPRYDDLALPDVVLGLYDWTLAWDHEQSRAWLISTGIPETEPPARTRRAQQRMAAVRAWLQSGAPRQGSQTASVDAVAAERPPAFTVRDGWWDSRLEIKSSFTHRAYVEAVTKVRDYIFAGDVFQANLSQRLEAACSDRPWLLYQRLRQRNAAPFAAYLEYPDHTILSASPERFLQVTGDHIETRPIKGTRPRGLGPEHDAALGLALTESVKDRAENLMIVDLMRNDLSRVCRPGTVRVAELFALERYATVHHLVSTVVGDLDNGRTAADVVRAAFPGGSITGAPKVRAMEIIAELEPSARHVYCGSIAYWSATGAFDSSIAIRTGIWRGGQLYFNAGGGIVADSDPEQEYRETLDKARGIIDAL